MNTETSINEAINSFKKLYWKPRACCLCSISENVKECTQFNDDYCESCLEKILREDLEDLFESISEEQDFNY